MWFVSASRQYYHCVNTINCTGQNMSQNLLIALGDADANMFLCSKALRPGEENTISSHLSDLALVTVNSSLHLFCSLFFVMLILIKQ